MPHSTTQLQAFKPVCGLRGNGWRNSVARIQQKNWPIFSHWTPRWVCRRVKLQLKIKMPEKQFSGIFERLAATYSRGSYTTTTIGKTVFDGRVRNGNGSDHSFMATKLFCTVSTVLNFKRSFPKYFGDSLKTTHRSLLALQLAS